MKLIALLLLPILCFAQKFTSEEATFSNLKYSVTLSATITIPNDVKFPTVAILISGSGQTDRDETIFKHQLFKELAEHLSAKGIAVVRYDDRGGYKSTGRSVAESTSYELSEDAEQIFFQLKKDKRFRKSKIGFIGHSEGGFIAPMIAARNPKVAFIVSMAGTAVDGKSILLKQNRDIMLKQGVNETAVHQYLDELFEPMLNVIQENEDDEIAKSKIAELTKNYRKDKGANSLVSAMFSNEKYAETVVAQIGGVWGRYFISTSPKQFWQQVKCPVLALNGDLDLQVDHDLNLFAIEQYLVDSDQKKSVTIRSMPSHNHLFQVAKTGSIMEYGQLKEGLSDATLSTISDWLLALK
ncbi:MAG: alpha/beta hydrolase [Spirosomaceae bacterium]|nr:alpha/beta hydrolase [Spirosomataceae bacterium]